MLRIGRRHARRPHRLARGRVRPTGGQAACITRVLCGLRNRVTLNQNIFAAEFVLRIAPFRCVSVWLHAVMEIENLGGITKRSADLFFCPDIEGAFGGFRVTGIVDPAYNATVCIFGGEESAFLRRHVASDVIENVARH